MLPQKESLTKIVATIGPSSHKKEILRKMILEGLNVCRLNFSHGSYEDHKDSIEIIKSLNEELDANVAILADLQGPKLRIGEVENNELILNEGDTIDFVTEPCLGTREKMYMSYERFPSDVMPGETVLIDDGKMQFEVLETNRKDRVTLKAINGGIISSKKGVNLPNTNISLPSLTEKDAEDVKFILQQEVQWIALSFVRSVSDIIILKDMIKRTGKFVKVIAKIEKPEAVKSIDEILDLTDGVMVARGDLGVETPFDQVPVLQKEIVHKCIQKEKPVIIATQMMEGMINNFLPTRAEATDVSNAVLDGADAVMLSGETSVGKYPVEVIVNMKKIIKATEHSGFFFDHEHQPSKQSIEYATEMVCYNACKMADLVDAKGIVVFSFMGGTAVRISSFRPKALIFAFSSDPHIMKMLSLSRGVFSFPIGLRIDINDAIEQAMMTLKTKGWIKSGDKIVTVVGVPMKKRESVNTINISTVD